jgi:hypothetical protein
MMAGVKVTVFWDTAPCSLVEVERRFRGAYCLHHQGDLIALEAERVLDTSVNFYEIKRRSILKDCRLLLIC